MCWLGVWFTDQTKMKILSIKIIVNRLQLRDQNVITWSHKNDVKFFWKSNFILKHLKSIELKILWNHILKPVLNVKMAESGQPCNYFCLLKKVFYFFFSYEIRIFCRWVWKDCNTKKRGFIPEITPCGSEVLYHVL